MPSALRHEAARKAIHVGSAALPIGYAAGLPRATLLALLGGAVAVALTVEVARHRSPRARATFGRAVGALLRPHEHDRWSGATWLAIAYLLATLLFPRREAVAAMLAVALGDAAAALVGRWWQGRRARPPAAPAPPAPPAPRPGKSWAGSVACALAAAAGALLVAGLMPAAAAACGVAAALAERPRGPGDDNVRIALAAGAAAVAAAAVWPRG